MPKINDPLPARHPAPFFGDNIYIAKMTLWSSSSSERRRDKRHPRLTRSGGRPFMARRVSAPPTPK